MRVWLFIVLLASATYSQMPPLEPGVSQDLAKWRAARYSDVRYKLNLTLEKMSPVLKGMIEIRVNVEVKSSGPIDKTAGRVSEPGAIATGFLPPIVLDWREIPGHEKDSTISNVSINGTSLKEVPNNAFIVEPYSFPAFFIDSQHIVFEDGVRIGENVIKLDFTSPILTSGSAITRYIDKEDGSEYIYSLFVPSDASTAFPCFDQPDLKARFQLKIQTSGRGTEPWTAISNTDPEHSFSSTWGVMYDFKETQPISTYVFAFAIGDFSVFNESGYTKDLTKFPEPRKSWLTLDFKTNGNQATQSIQQIDEGLKIYLRKSQFKKFEAHAAEVFRLTREGIKYLENYFDYKFPFPKYDLVLIPEFPFGGMEHAGATFLREDRIIFPQEPTKNDYITRANLIFHETAHQWFGDTVTMKWFDDLWLKEGFAEFMAYKTMEHVMPEYNAWKVFYERNKQAAYLTDSTKGTTPIYQPIANLSAAKSAYGNIVYRKAPSFLRQAEFYLGEDKFQIAVRAFLKKHEFANATWEDLVKEFETPNGKDLAQWANVWVKQKGVATLRFEWQSDAGSGQDAIFRLAYPSNEKTYWNQKLNVAVRWGGTSIFIGTLVDGENLTYSGVPDTVLKAIPNSPPPEFIFPNYGDYGYGIFLLDDKSRDYVLKNIQNEKDDFLRSMMWGSLWDSVREAELDPKDYVELVLKNLGGQNAEARASARAKANRDPSETDETTVQTLLSRATAALNYYIPAPPNALANARASASNELLARFEELLLDKLQHASTPGQRITYYRAYVNTASSDKAHEVLKQMLEQAAAPVDKTPGSQPRTKDKFEIVTRLIILGDPEAPKLLANLEKTETGDDAKRYAYAARAAFGTAENKAKYWNDFVNNKDISESWIESAILPFNTLKQSDLTLPYLERSLAELPNLKRSRKIFFVNNWLGAFIAGQRSEQALIIVNKLLASNPNLDNDLRLKILENADLIERAVKIRAKFGSK